MYGKKDEFWSSLSGLPFCWRKTVTVTDRKWLISWHKNKDLGFSRIDRGLNIDYRLSESSRTSVITWLCYCLSVESSGSTGGAPRKPDPSDSVSKSSCSFKPSIWRGVSLTAKIMSPKRSKSPLDFFHFLFSQTFFLTAGRRPSAWAQQRKGGSYRTTPHCIAIIKIRPP